MTPLNASENAAECSQPDVFQKEPLILNGKTVAQTIYNRLETDILTLKQNGVRLPQLVVILVGDDPASQVYVGKKAKVAKDIGIQSQLITLPTSTTEEELLGHLKQLNEDDTVDAILVQLPLPKHMDEFTILQAITPHKDVDGFHPVNQGWLMVGHYPPALPCTPKGMMTLLAHYRIPVEGKHAVVIGRSNIVGKPVAQLLLHQNATVTMAHSHTRNLTELCQTADILVSAVGQPGLITPAFIKAGAVVLDVGINRLPSGKLTGDVAYEDVLPLVSAITPVPGGVGPMTIATLMENTVALYSQVKFHAMNIGS